MLFLRFVKGRSAFFCFFKREERDDARGKQKNSEKQTKERRRKQGCHISTEECTGDAEQKHSEEYGKGKSACAQVSCGGREQGRKKKEKIQIHRRLAWEPQDVRKIDQKQSAATDPKSKRYGKQKGKQIIE